MASLFEHPKDRVVYIQTQGADSYQTDATLPVAADALQVEEIEIVPPSGFNTQRHRDQIGIMSKEGTVTQMKEGTFRLMIPLRPSGAVATEMDAAVAFKVGIWNATVSTPTASTVDGTWSAYNTGDVANAAGMAVGDVVGFTDANGFVWGRRIKTISSNTLTIEAPLHFLPANSAAVTASKTYTLNTANTETSFTLWNFLTYGAQKAGGCVPTSYRVTWGSNDRPVLEVSGEYREYHQASNTTLDGGINNAVTTMVVDEWLHLTKNMTLTIEAEGANAAEAILVTAEPSSTTITMSRNADGGGADSHGDTAVISPYQPASLTLNGADLDPKGCNVVIAASTTLQSTLRAGESGTLEIAGGIAFRKAGHGDEWINAGYNLSSDLAAKVNYTTWMEKRTWDDWQRAALATELPAAIQWGESAGSIAYWEAPRMVRLMSVPASSGDEFVGATIEAEDRGSRTGSTAFSFATL